MNALVGFNHLFIDSTPLTGPGYYAVQVLENIVRLPQQQLAGFEFKVFVRAGTQQHYSDLAQPLLLEMPFKGGRFARVAHEQLLLPWRARREGVDLLFSPGFVTPLFGAPLLAATIHDMYYRVLPEAVEPFQRLYWRAMVPLTSRVCDLLVTVSQNSQRDIERYLPTARGKLVVTPLASRFDPADRQEPARRSRRGAPYILMIANLTPNKNVSKVVEAIALLRDRGTRVDLVHIGVDMRGELARAVAAHGLHERVRSLGKVDDVTLVATARSSLGVVVASLYEGFGLPAIEAQALGAPLICSTAGALPEVVGDAALMFAPNDPKALAAQVARLLDEPDLGELLRSRGLANAARFSWKRTAERTLDAFASHLRRAGRLG